MKYFVHQCLTIEVDREVWIAILLVFIRRWCRLVVYHNPPNVYHNASIANYHGAISHDIQTVDTVA